jgi:hypothetical protein
MSCLILASEMFLSSFSSSLSVLVDCRVVIGLHPLPMLLTPKIRRLLVILANVLSIP